MKRAAVLMMLMVGAPALAADKSAHSHARKANGLAAAGKCKQAIPEYNAAYRLLKDPALLFNRAECLRKMGRGAQAAYDYKKFLEEMPAAPNRKLVESRILELDPSAGIPTKTIAQVPPPAVETPAPSPEPPTLTPTPTPTAPEKEPAPSPAPALQVAALRAPLPVMAAEPAPEPAPVAAPAAAVLVEQPRPVEAHAPDRAWLWMSVAAAVVAASAGGALYVTGKPHNP